MSVKILADSACDLPLSFFEENDVTLIPLKVHLGDEEYDDIITIDSKKIYDAIRGGQVPKTSQASPLLFEEIFTAMAKNNEDGIYIAFSSELSGTYQTAVMMLDQVKEAYPDFKLQIIDSKCASLGHGLVVKEAAKFAKNNVAKEEIIKDIQFRCEHMEHLFTVNDLEYLAKGGRVSRASAFLGGLLNIKPLLNVEDGKLVPIEKHRGKKKLLRRIIEIMKERGESLDQQLIGISHGDDEETALEMKALIEKELNVKQFYITQIGSAVGSHAGAGTIAIFFLNKLSD
ncbi:DegV family protein [Cytobacillus purgationiresistens]|uniref:DegV family protein with EDD domain n=1 Tax=Cytobacillus purgationiresistens TaxID=863449 RepID=A0ABU0ADH0_9BACI|nr:DegV family protein [Cytobacillus purgationiresistens]MDQ0268776.1 DegV family protein with EDD domain [Cytobacillus purgationiresistens]